MRVQVFELRATRVDLNSFDLMLQLFSFESGFCQKLVVSGTKQHQMTDFCSFSQGVKLLNHEKSPVLQIQVFLRTHFRAGICSGGYRLKSKLSKKLYLGFRKEVLGNKVSFLFVVVRILLLLILRSRLCFGRLFPLSTLKSPTSNSFRIPSQHFYAT